MADGKGKTVMENEVSHSEEHNQNLSNPQSKTTKKLRKRKVKEGDVASIPEDVSALKKKNKTTLTTDGSKGAAEVLIALPSPTSKAKVGLRQPPSSPRGQTPNQPAGSQANDIHGSIIQPPALNSAHELPNVTDGDQGDGVNLAANSIHPSVSNSPTPLPVAADAAVGGATRRLGNVSSLQRKKQCPAAAVVNVEGYKVKAEFAATAQYIINKHGDVVAVTSFKGSLLTHLLENVCQIYQKLEKSDFTDLTIEELEVMCIELHDFQKINVNVGWLLSRLEDILNGKKVLQTLDQELMKAKEKFKRLLEKSLVDDI